ncbi:hypothetical protein PDE_01816 [Penicillium oxalicum 114-2]|uniref:Uncharacterized protein n=1 Tax=Penicillium oxalicum (strain 114-2 / CGMCC 5302) TaxID=933388 RepID=S7ZDX7_PENO1|nr:hypothetical protein PDE_01816 [Penicillium oxalicum 114-2]
MARKYSQFNRHEPKISVVSSTSAPYTAQRRPRHTPDEDADADQPARTFVRMGNMRPWAQAQGRLSPNPLLGLENSARDSYHVTQSCNAFVRKGGKIQSGSLIEVMEDITEGDIKRIKHQALFLVHPKLRDGGSTEIRFPVPWAWDPGAAPKESRKVAMDTHVAAEFG